MGSIRFFGRFGYALFVHGKPKCCGSISSATSFFLPLVFVVLLGMFELPVLAFFSKGKYRTVDLVCYCNSTITILYVLLIPLLGLGKFNVKET